ncbi:MAG: hypothetical protein LBK52_01650, partial [Deltaproteobacteria bacterium]|nr:hypothetical protein [Deltaproteobacteria bacterium]
MAIVFFSAALGRAFIFQAAGVRREGISVFWGSDDTSPQKKNIRYFPGRVNRFFELKVLFQAFFPLYNDSRPVFTLTELKNIRQMPSLAAYRPLFLPRSVLYLSSSGWPSLDWFTCLKE